MKIINFSSHTDIWYYAFAEATVAFYLQKGGYENLYITPGSSFSNISNPMQERIVREEFNLPGYEIGTVLGKEDWEEINLILRNLNEKNFEKLVIDNIKLGKIALYEFLLKHKKNSLDFNKYEWKECQIYLKNTLISFFACRIIINKERPDAVIMYSTLYSVNHVWKKYAEFKNISVYFLHHGLNLSDTNNNLIIAKNNSIEYYKRLLELWPNLRTISVPKKILSYVTDHFIELLEAKHQLVYSVAKSKKKINIKNRFNIKSGQKILTATMSSYDELFAAEYVGVRDKPRDLIFNSQLDWIKALLHYVKKNPNLFLIIRVHPREFPNKRDGVKSKHSEMLEKEFNDLPVNVKVNWPTDNISIYDLAQETDVFLNAWSSVGVEMSLLGMPVVVYSKKLILYPDDINYLAKNKKDYFNKIQLALKDGWNYEKVKKTYRWLSLVYGKTSITFQGKNKKLKKVVRKKKATFIDYIYKFIPSQTKRFIVNLLVMIPGFNIGKKQKEDCRRQLTEKVDISKVDKMLNNSGDTLVDVNEILANKITGKDEDFFIRGELKRLYKFMYDSEFNDTLYIKKGSLRYNLKKAIINK